MPIFQNLIVEDADLPPILSYTVDGQGQASGASPTFAPPDISGNLLWLRSDLGITIATGVSAWADQSGNGNNLTQATGGRQPVYSAAGGPNGLPMLVCTAASIQDMTGIFTVGSAPTYLWIIVLWNTLVAAQTMCDGHAADSLRLAGASSSAVEYLGTSAISSGSVVSTGVWYNYGLTMNGATSSIVQNGVTIASGSTGTVITPTGFTIGAEGLGNNNNGNVSFAEVALYNRLPTAGQIQQLTNYRVARYGF